MSPAYWHYHPVLAFFADCGLGSDPDATGPCTGTYGPGPLSNALNEQLFGGKEAVMAVGLALLVLAGLLFLIRTLKRTANPASKGSVIDDDGDFDCHGCGADSVTVSDGIPFCDDCFAARLVALQPGHGWCAHCDVTYLSDEDGESSCPSCGGGEDAYSDTPADESGDEPDADGEASSSDAQAGRGFDSCAACGEPAEPGDIEENGGVCNKCRWEYVDGAESGRGVGHGEGFR